ncbi:MAG: hypothetical protein HYU37_09010 [Acidobacteria bacterium]|nr:hypothetical protein [Acidobacteriota bacterium]
MLPRWIWVVYLTLFAASVPWYVPAGPLRIWFGLPHWVVLSIAAIAGVALFTTVVVRRYWPDDDEPGRARR